MNWEILRNSSLVENLGWTLVHSLWQIGLIALVLFSVLRFLKKSAANTRYLSAVAALALTLILPFLTFFWLDNNSEQSRLTDKIYNTEKFNQINERAQSPELSQAAENNLQTANLTAENDFLSFENLQKSFTSNLASALPLIVLLWICGVGASAVRLGGGVWQLHKYKTREVSAPEIEWQKRFANLREKLQIVQTVRFLQSSLIKTPVVIGWLKPVILIPASVFLQMNPVELETILAHELLHIRRLDNLVNFAQSFAEILFFYHPCGWWISGVIRREREFACDAAVLEILDSQRFVYAKALTNLEEIRLRAKQTLPQSLATAATGGKLMQRIERILEKNAESGGNSKQTLWSAGCLAFLIVSAILTNVFWAGTAASVNAQTENKRGNKRIAVGFVSIPPNYGEGADETTRLLMAKLTAHKVPAIGFVSGATLSMEKTAREQGEKINELVSRRNDAFDEKSLSNTADAARARSLGERLKAQQLHFEKMISSRAEAVRMWRDAGFEIGTGGYNHIWFYDTPYEDYVANTEKSLLLVKALLAEKNLPLRYFSYPFLNTGKTAEDKAQFESWLAGRGLRSVKYTFDNSEWMYSYAYDEARKDNDIDRMREIQAEFVDYMTRMTDHYEAYSADMFGRDIAQTMVLTPSRLVADSFDEVFGMLERRDYRFVSMDEAQADTAYNTAENFAGVKAGISWFERWQLTRGAKLRDEPKVDKSVSDVWDNRNNKIAPLPPKPPAPPIPPPPPPAPPVKEMS